MQVLVEVVGRVLVEVVGEGIVHGIFHGLGRAFRHPSEPLNQDPKSFQKAVCVSLVMVGLLLILALVAACCAR